ncbi:MAG: anaerobic ribonucleoside-triphosphate reductase activating protein [Proteobacteria bacterium]|nr:anaerobic ribonucleoside-triphosphate reductase activating protein [Pseudomonadota bacterium]
MKIGGLQRVSLIDYPGKICAILFTQGCDFRCPYCHNPELVNPDLYEECIPEDEIFSFLERRRGKLDAVTITGGEPTVQPDLVEFARRVKKMGYLVKIDTNGSRPEVLKKLIDRKLVDYIAMDVKAPLEKYRKICKANVNYDNIRRSIKMIMDSGVEYEFRTTVVKSLLTGDDLQKIGNEILGARLYVLQKFVPSKSLDERFLAKTTYSDKYFETLKEKLGNYVHCVVVR